MTEAELVGRFVALTADVQTGGQTIAKGTILKITRKFGGFDANTEPCQHCGVGARIKRLRFEEVDLMPKDFKPRR